MLILRLWNYFRGYVIIDIEGLNLERFINSCIENNIYLWNIKRLSYTKIEAHVGIRGFKALRRLSRKTGCRVSIATKFGYPFWAHRLKKRKMLIAGAFFSLIVVIVASSFIYSVDVVGNEKVDEESLRSALVRMGLKPGSNRYAVDLREIENQILIEFNELAWVGIELKGIYAKVEVVEKYIQERVIDKNNPCNVVAKKNGVIDQVIAKNGDSVVKEGDIVVAGDLLISGVVSRENMDPTFLHAYGEVLARTYYEKVITRELTIIKKEKTGEKSTVTRIGIGKLKLSFGDSEVPFGNYILEKNMKRPTIWRNIRLPVEIIKEEYFEAMDIEEKLDIEVVKEEIHQEAIDYLMGEIPEEAEILNTFIDFKEVGDQIQGKFTIEVLEDIALQEKIDNRED
ncbi:sporulation protein YqfD [Alkaliphilus serpentinus]|uniref:Sporulation protein YqfD n=1 Tax=Alkaliphilus serpentinus TaxID=1482731 RepID=A0A833HRP2_9FIRM|nr:sporulation protein YqfD [Alkaliphilus serpentinus]KAB3533255.1 sporulation protein YqfD [Alkaliphilus serpentinus]